VYLGVSGDIYVENAVGRAAADPKFKDFFRRGLFENSAALENWSLSSIQRLLISH
jgi:hypothetical protein